MKYIEDFLLKLAQLDIKVWAESDQLCCDAPKEILTTELRAELAERKVEILQFLHKKAIFEQDIPPLSKEATLAISLAQQRLWFLYQLEGPRFTYNMPVSLHLEGQLNEIALQRSLLALIQRHESLRLSFPMVNGEASIQRGEVYNPLSIIDISELSSGEQQRIKTEEIANHAQILFALSTGPLLSLRLIKLGKQEHILLFNMHHIISDGWSMSVLVRDWSQLYNAYAQNQLPRLPKLPIQYTDFAAWQRNWLQGEVLEQQLAYWTEKLTGAPELLELPTDYPRPAMMRYFGQHLQSTLGIDITREIKQLSQQYGVTVFMTLLAAFKVLLFRYSGQNDLVVGSPIANRTHHQTEDLIGFFVNTLVLRTQIEGEQTFPQLLKQVKQTALEAYNHQDIPFESLVEQLNPSRSLSHSPLFQVVFVLQNVPSGSLELSDVKISFLESENTMAKVDLTLSVTEADGILVCDWEYNTDLFRSDTITRMTEHFYILLEGILNNPEQSLSFVPLLTEAEKQKLLVWNNQTDASTSSTTDYPFDKTIVDLFQAQVEKTPDNIAVIFPSISSEQNEDQQLSYQELNTKANQLAFYLMTLGVGAETLVGICIERSLEMVISLLGILKAGGAYVPFDPDYPPERLQFMLEDSEVAVLLSQSHLLERLPATQENGIKVVCLNSEWKKIAAGSGENPVRQKRPENLAYVIYTSGSTGVPKGVCVPQRAVVRLVHQTNYACLDAEQTFLQYAPISFDAATLELWGALLNGAKLVVMPPDKRSLSQLSQVIQEQGVTILWLTSSLFNLMLDEQPEGLLGIKQLLVGGEELSVPHIQHALNILSGTQLINGYGPTENTTFTCCYPIIPKDYPVSIPIGKPIANTSVYILDGYQQPQPIGLIGELYTGGLGLARGYLNRPKLSKEKFIEIEVFGKPQRFYKTGDLARWLPDGNIEFLGRFDHQVKLRGFRIELGEIEATLTLHPWIREAVVLIPDEPSHNKRLVAYLVGHKSQQIDNTELRIFLKEHLPDYMVPSVFVSLEAMPLTPNGKVDRRVLAKLSTTHYQPTTKDFVAPSTSEEELLAKIWAEVIGIKQVSIHDNFFELGGDSILSIQVISRANRAGLQLSVKQLFEHQTVAELASLASTMVRLRNEQSLVTGFVPLTPIQHWFFAQNLPEPHHFNQAILLKVSPNLTLTVLKQIVTQLLRHHDALRLRFADHHEQWLTDDKESQSVDNCLLINDLSALTLDEQRIKIEATAAELQANFSLSDGPLLRVAFFELDNEQTNRLLFVIHHLAVDGVSWRILLEDFAIAYQQLKDGKTTIVLPPKTTSFKQWAERLTEYAKSQTLAAELDYWLAEDRMNVVPLPLDFPSKPLEENTVASEAQVSMSLSVEETQALLQKIPPVYHTQINDVLLTAFLQSFTRWTGTARLLVDLEGHGREEIFEDVDISRTVGWFTSIVPVFLELESIFHEGEALKYIKEQLRHLPQRGIGYGLLKYLNPETAQRLQTLPQAQVSFNYLGQFAQTFSEEPLLGLAQETIGLAQGPLNYRSHLLDIKAIIQDRQLLMSLTYSKNFHKQSTIKSLAQHFIAALQALIAHCQLPEAGGYTPSDFPEANLNQTQWDQLQETLKLENQIDPTTWNNYIEAIYPLSPSQQGMLIETLSALHSGIHIEQSIWRFRGDLDVKVFRQAWQRVLERHSVLRTAFIWQGLAEETLQVVLKHVTIPLEAQDWCHLSPLQQRERLEAYLKTDRLQGFNVSKAPLMRLAIFLVDEHNYDIVWTSHHILMDGWCTAMIHEDVLYFYEASRREQKLSLELSPPYRDYIRWLKQQDISRAQVFWQRVLQGVTEPTPLGIITDGPPSHDSNDKTERYGSQEVRLSSKETAALQSLVRLQGVTFSSLIQGVWALLLSRYSGDTEVVFGLTVSGRPADLAGVETMMGLFINTLPMQVKVSTDISLWSWIKQIHTQNQERSPYEYCSAGQVHQWSNVPSILPLYESILVFENYPIEDTTQPSQILSELDLEVSDGYHVGAQTQYALTILVLPSTQLVFQVVYDRERFNDADITLVIKHFMGLLKSIANGQEILTALSYQIPATQIPKVRASQIQRTHFVAPRDPLELQLASIWENILDVHPIGVHDNFFELGGHSWLAVSLMAQIEQQLNKHLPLATLFQGATVEQLATVLRQQSEEESWSSLVPIQPNGSNPPFFCVPGAGGNIIYFYELARYLGQNQPFYGLQAVGLDGESIPYTCVEDMATHYIKEIQTVQPEGPYLLGGHSFGSFVAFEMAQQLQGLGQEVGLVAILDTLVPHPLITPVGADWDDARWMVDVAHAIEELLGKKVDISYDELKSFEPEQQLFHLGEQLVQVGWLPPKADLKPLRGMVEIYKTNVLTSYFPEPEKASKIRIALLQASETPTMEETADMDEKGKNNREIVMKIKSEPTWGWGEFASEAVMVHVVPGNHISMMSQPHVQHLAEKLKLCLEQALVADKGK